MTKTTDIDAGTILREMGNVTERLFETIPKSDAPATAHLVQAVRLLHHRIGGSLPADPETTAMLGIMLGTLYANYRDNRHPPAADVRSGLASIVANREGDSE